MVYRAVLLCAQYSSDHKKLYYVYRACIHCTYVCCVVNCCSHIHVVLVSWFLQCTGICTTRGLYVYTSVGRAHRVKIPQLVQMTNMQLTHWLSRFTLEVRKKDGSEYPSNSLHHICAGIQRHLRGNGRIVDLFTDTDLSLFQGTLDGEMK